MGSSTFLTDKNGDPYQHFSYMPYGEMLAEYSTGQFTDYKFNGKELDEETRLHYYGARYYDARTSIWLSVDPMAAKASGWTPYRYCFNNPISFTDPNGMFEDWVQAADGDVYWDNNATSQATTKTGETYLSSNYYNKSVVDAIGSDIMNSADKMSTFTNYVDNKGLGENYFIEAAKQNYASNAGGLMEVMLESVVGASDGLLVSEMTHDWVNQSILGNDPKANQTEHYIGCFCLPISMEKLQL